MIDVAMLIRFDIYNFIERCINRTPLHTPNRIQFVRDEIKSYVHQIAGDSNNIDIVQIRNYPVFQCTDACIDEILRTLPRLSASAVDSTLVLIPKQTYCCNKTLRIDARYSSLTVYAMDGLKSCRYFHGRCLQCKYSYYYNFKEFEGTRFFEDIRGQDYFAIASGIGFSTELFDFVSLEVTIGNVAFEKIAAIYNNKNNLVNTSHALQSQTLEENWLLYRLLQFHTEVLWERKEESHKYHVEKLCQQLYPKVKEAVDSTWLHHKCREPGCANRFIVLDGNEKLFRYACSEPFKRISGGNGL